jgi:hypothetical protein
LSDNYPGSHVSDPSRPQPIAFTLREGSYWLPWEKELARVAHAIWFSNGWIFDAWNGWRPQVKTPEETKEMLEAIGEGKAQW